MAKIETKDTEYVQKRKKEYQLSFILSKMFKMLVICRSILMLLSMKTSRDLSQTLYFTSPLFDHMATTTTASTEAGRIREDYKMVFTVPV